jgi:hypothetical protein
MLLRGIVILLRGVEVLSVNTPGNALCLVGTALWYLVVVSDLRLLAPLHGETLYDHPSITDDSPERGGREL